jgi:hypothetical protein
LTRFLATLATDPDLMAAYLRDREKVIRESGLTPEDVAALGSGDRSELAARLHGETSPTTASGPSPSAAGCPVVYTLPSIALVPMPTFGVAVSVPCPPNDPAQIIIQVTSVPLYDTSGPIPTFTHMPISQQADRESPPRRPPAHQATGTGVSEPSGKGQDPTRRIYDPIPFIPTFTHYVIIEQITPSAGPQRSSAEQSATGSGSNLPVARQTSAPGILRGLSH